MKRKPRHPKRCEISAIFMDAIRTRTLFRDGDGTAADFHRIIRNISEIESFSDVSDKMIAEPIGASLRTIGVGLQLAPFDPSCELHASCFGLISEYTRSANTELAAFATWALGDIGIPPTAVRERLVELVGEPPRFEPGKTGTCRAVALRMLARHDMKTASRYGNAPVFNELSQMLIDFRQRSIEEFPKSTHLVHEIDAELKLWDKLG